jgi:VWFA-related protein
MLLLLLTLAFAIAPLQASAQASAPTRGAEALSLFGSADDDRTLVYLASGPPETRTPVACPALFRPIEVWTYAAHPRLGAGGRLVFVQEKGSGEYRTWTLADGDAALIAETPQKATLDELGSRKADCAEAPLLLEAVRAVGARQHDAAGGLAERDAIATGRRSRPAPPPKPASTIELPAGASPLPVVETVRFPEEDAGGMRMELSLAVERAKLAPRPLGDETFYGVDVAGEVRKGGKVVDDFRYRFDFAASSLSGPSVPLQIERALPPGVYTLSVRVSDLYANGAALLHEKLTVPSKVAPSLDKEEQAVRDAAREAAKDAAAASGDAITLIRPSTEVAIGRVHLETRTSSEAVAAAEFYLDGTRVLTKRRPPFEVDLDLGDAPRKHIVKVIGYRKDGSVAAQDELTLNEGREAFRVRIASPEKGSAVSGPTRVVAEISIPGTRRLKQLELYLDETRAAVLYKPPFEETIDVPATEAVRFVRAVATLDDGAVAEDVRYLNAPFVSEANVDAVELYTAVFAKGRPVTGLSKESFHVLEDGVPQDVQGFEVVTKLPLALGLAIDTSESMDESMKEVQKAATEFLKDLMTPKDRCFFVTFSDAPRLASSFTTDRDRLGQLIGDLKAHGMTALWDALETGLFQFQGIRGRKAFVVLTDGEDTASKKRYETVLDYARKSGVAVYVIGMNLPVNRQDIRYKMSRLAKETGGAVYHIASARGLAKIYKQIDEELRSQYLLTYIPKSAGKSGKWRKVEVKMAAEEMTARTIAGYYP